MPLSLVTQAYSMVMAERVQPELDGSQGVNRGLGRAQIGANNDWEAVRLWLDQYRAGSATRAAYEKEVTRFFVWVLAARKKALSSVIYEDWQAYESFMSDPQPASEWVGPRNHKRGSPAYRPFAGPLSASSQNYARTVIWTMFDWLCGVGYLAGNPIIANRRQRQSGKRYQTRYLPGVLWQTILASIDQYPRKTLVEKRRYAQARWLISLFYLTGIRTSEAVTATMRDFHWVTDRKTGQQYCFLRVIGKGDKQRNVPATAQLLLEMQAYRQAFGLPPAPPPDDTTPLVFSLQAKQGFKAMTRQTLYLALKGVFQKASQMLEQTDPAGAETLLTASTHWLRHTAATEMLNNGTDLRTVQGVLGHESLATTGIYSHTEDLRMHQDIEGRHDLPWETRPATKPAA